MLNIHKHRHWEIVRIDNKVVGKLYFNQQDNDEVILSFQEDDEDEEIFWYSSDLLKVEIDCIQAYDENEAVKDFECKIIEHIEDEINSLEMLLDRFEELRK